MTPTNTPAGKAEELGHKASEAIGERIALNAAMLRLFKGQYRNSSDRHSDALFVRCGLESLTAELATLQRELAEANQRIDECAKHAIGRSAKMDDTAIAFAEGLAVLTAELTTLRAQLGEAKADNERLEGICKDHAEALSSASLLKARRGSTGAIRVSEELGILRSDRDTLRVQVAKLREALTDLKAACANVLLPAINEAMAKGYKMETWVTACAEWGNATIKTDAVLTDPATPNLVAIDRDELEGLRTRLQKVEQMNLKLASSSPEMKAYYDQQIKEFNL